MIITGNNVTLDQVVRVAHDTTLSLELSPDARQSMVKSRAFIENKIAGGEVMYGVNTGFGAFSSVRISDDEIERLQRNLIRSHCCGVGNYFSPEQTRAIMFLRANTLARGHSGIRPEVVDKILEFLNHNVIPCVPSQGSVGASGDLAPLAHLALALIGEGEVWSEADGKAEAPTTSVPTKWEPKPCSQVLPAKNLIPLVLKAKEGLSLINGCQVMTAVGLLAAAQTRRLLFMADAAGAMTLEALKGSRKAFDPLIAATRPHPGEAKTARNMLKILGDSSPISLSHTHCNKVQDAYSLRCIPAVHGATKDALRRTVETLEIEANSSTDNPLVFADDGKILSCGNFHGEPVAFVLDYLGIAVSAMASMSECRIEKLINPNTSDLPAFLTPQGGLNSGHMIVQVCAAALVSENKILAHPASVDSIPTSADKEDHVSMGTIAARKLQQIVANAENILAMELLSASQALDFLKPLSPAGAVLAFYQHIRSRVPFANEDRIFSKDIATLREMIENSELENLLFSQVKNLEW